MGTNKKLLIFGLGDMARMAHFYFTNGSEYEVAAFSVTRDFAGTEEYLKLPIIPFDEANNNYPPEEFEMFIAVGYKQMNKIRAEYYYKAKEKGYRLANYISPKATTYGDLVIGDNCFVFEDNTIQPFVKIGSNVIIWSGNHIGHDAVIKDHCFITSHVVISSHVEIGENSFLGINSTIRNKVKIGRECVIGAGALVLKDTIDKGVYISNPAELSKVPSDRLKDL